VNYKEIRCDVMDWIHLPWDCVQSLALMSMVMNPVVLEKEENFITS
jgi:hypothetical protein